MKKLDSNGLALCKYQAEIFRLSVEKVACSSLVFLRRYFRSDFAKLMDMGDSTRFAFDPDEAFEAIERQFGPSSYGKEKYSGEALYWVGYITRYICYTRKCSSVFVYRNFPPELLIEAYPGFHTQGEEWVVERLLEMIGKTEDYFDPNYRLKEILRRKMGLQLSRANLHK